ncbi:MAG: hypothetical protein GWM92_15765 [Gemmatimonadetes bacterium]|nr:hypothetical protein [Gemmatimonadota bacterium]NIR80189.1 hypothetical protein [Gemmatimonadota bacterium]NIT88951.1 hypothetical protein [Gemmatimonadota bacterium]NIU32746.1 hypothetical protein [Gemmatimonadota bacterium]NIU37178.1 hypothetical protein [Gemmatimonadota bacterium]
MLIELTLSGGERPRGHGSHLLEALGSLERDLTKILHDPDDTRELHRPQEVAASLLELRAVWSALNQVRIQSGPPLPGGRASGPQDARRGAHVPGAMISSTEKRWRASPKRLAAISWTLRTVQDVLRGAERTADRLPFAASVVLISELRELRNRVAVLRARVDRLEVETREALSRYSVDE